ncbi:hypothetical protein [Ottowia thiooxydans]|uniref:hypothetical protein n=1 Tax=Ottowia thiooxydans TaxID=219182 RepID=UPI0012EC01D1|nr:hypothetical protein [Ottowia thiooxydans]
MATSKTPNRSTPSAKAAEKTPAQGREATASTRSRSRKALPASVVSDGTDALHVDLAFAKPDWDKQTDNAVRPLWEIAALAMGIDPVSKGVTARRKLDSEWAAAYLRLVTAMCDALSPKRGGGIYYDPTKPANISRIGNKKDLKFVRVDAASATAFVVNVRKHTPQPPEFAQLQTLLAHAATPENTSIPKFEASEQSTPPKKSQEQANETKASKILMTLLYIVVEQEMGGWADADTAQRGIVVNKILKHLDRHEIRSTRGMSPDAIEDLLDMGMGLAPLRLPPSVNVHK